MNLQSGLAAAPTALALEPGQLPASLSGPETALLAMAEPGLISRIAIIAPGGLELACALLRHGHSDVTLVRLSDWHRADKADIVIMPQVSSAELLERAIPCARRMLAPLGAVVAHLAADLPGPVTQQAERLLMLHGFTTIQARTLFGEVLLRAELPPCGRMTCA